VPGFDSSIAALIDHTLLKPEATEADIRRLCAEARQYRFASVCINPCWVSVAAAELVDSDVMVCTVAGFPLGASSTQVKSFEAGVAMSEGADEIDMVLNVGALIGGSLDMVRDDIAAVTETAHLGDAIVKVIIETALLTDEQKIAACRLAQEAGADFVKTSTGFSTSGATAADVALMRRTVGPDMGVKASGGIRTLDDLKKMVAAGATRIGASASVKIVESTAA
jgi:deoxyribose-phosphate aldolase